MSEDTKHPEVEELVAYHEGRVAADAAEALAEHLSVCGHCARLLLDLDSFPDLEPPAGTSDPSEHEVAAAWRRLEAELPAPTAPSLAAIGASPRSWGTLAAALGLVALGFGGGWLTRRGDDAPRVNVPIVDLFAADAVRDAGAGNAVTVDPAADGWLLVLNLSEPALSGRYDLEMRDEGDTLVWSATAVAPDSHGGFTVSLPRGWLAPGRYRIAVVATGDPSRLVGEFFVTL